MNNHGAATQTPGSIRVNRATSCGRAARVTAIRSAAEPTLRHAARRGASACAFRAHDRILVALA